MGHWGNDAITVLKQAHEMGLKKKTKLFFNWIIDSQRRAFPPKRWKAFWCQMWWYHNMEGFKDAEVVKSAKEFTDRYMKAYGEPPDPYGMTAYDGAMGTEGHGAL